MFVTHIYYIFLQVKSEDLPSSKKRRTEWQAGLSKLPGDTTLVKDWVELMKVQHFLNSHQNLLGP